MKKQYFLIYLIFVGIFSCCISGIDNKMTYQVSESILESKKKGTFLDEFQVVDIQKLDSVYNYKFPIKRAWTEKPWYWGLDSITKKEIPIVIQNARGEIVWELYDNDTTLCSTNYSTKWIILDWQKRSTGTMGSLKFTIVYSSMPDSISVEETRYTIYLLNSNHAFDTINNTALYKFRLKKK